MSESDTVKVYLEITLSADEAQRLECAVADWPGMLDALVRMVLAEYGEQMEGAK